MGFMQLGFKVEFSSFKTHGFLGNIEACLHLSLIFFFPHTALVDINNRVLKHTSNIYSKHFKEMVYNTR